MFGFADPDANVITYVVSGFNNTLLAHKHFPLFKNNYIMSRSDRNV
jgi:hypothetical protein